MASPGNPNQQPQPAGFDMNKLFKPSSAPMNMNMMPPIPTPSSPNLTSSPSFPTPATAPPPPYLTPSSSYPPPTGPYSFHHHPHYIPYPPPPQHHPQLQLNRPPISYPPPLQPTSPVLPPTSSPHIPSTNPTSGGDLLMAFFGNPNQTISSPSPSSSEFQTAASSNPPPVPSAPPLSVSPAPMRLLSSKLPKGRHLIGNHVTYDIDVRFQGEAQPQLEVTPITKYASDPGLVLGRQIAVNRNYICYGLKLGAIRILNIITAMRSLLRGHTQVSSSSYQIVCTLFFICWMQLDNLLWLEMSYLSVFIFMLL